MNFIKNIVGSDSVTEKAIDVVWGQVSFSRVRVKIKVRKYAIILPIATVLYIVCL